MICLFGGTFDPVHAGHLHAARAVCDALELTHIRLLLSARPGHRGVPGASVEARWDMLRLACAEDPRFVPDDLEIRRARREGRPSYTVETLEELRAGAPDAVVAWVLGSDAFREITTWHRWSEVLTLTNLLVLKRPGAPMRLEPALETLIQERQVNSFFQRPSGSVRVLDLPMLDVSATAVRNALARSRRNPALAGGDGHLLPAAVYTYIIEHHLYGVVSDV